MRDREANRLRHVTHLATGVRSRLVGVLKLFRWSSDVHDRLDEWRDLT